MSKFINKKLHFICLTLAVSYILSANIAQAALPIPQDPNKIGLDDITNVLVYIIQFGLAFAAATGAIFIVISGYQYIVSAGNPEKIEKAKASLTWSIGGFGLALSSYAIVLLLQQVLRAQKKVSEHPEAKVATGNTTTILESILSTLFVFGGSVAVLFLIIGGYRYVTSQGNPDLIEGAKRTVLYSVIGLVVLFLSAAIFTLVRRSVEGQTF